MNFYRTLMGKYTKMRGPVNWQSPRMMEEYFRPGIYSALKLTAKPPPGAICSWRLSLLLTFDLLMV